MKTKVFLAASAVIFALSVVSCSGKHAADQDAAQTKAVEQCDSTRACCQDDSAQCCENDSLKACANDSTKACCEKKEGEAGK
ncbi:MAG: hypothetical protein LBL97_04815 [Prevotellaceae bacterium]|jgi:hypothetical protein|nr:hypothetical protein [Prevotellaceae bacterium]